ncbi:protein of unknown function [Nitrospira japonica]|uniref:Uncharacterized protein n=1 Tax=Nitrospira japonica TaxID=1325564 RepID=A0A1W1I8N7_9BACT|nr:protein of unknown function [Nitrospira japonica]
MGARPVLRGATRPQRHGDVVGAGSGRLRSADATVVDDALEVGLGAAGSLYLAPDRFMLIVIRLGRESPSGARVVEIRGLSPVGQGDHEGLVASVLTFR